MKAGSTHRRFFDLRVIIGAIIAVAASLVLVTPLAASASTAGGSPAVTTLRGGMVRVDNLGAASRAASATAPKALPSCSRIEYVGNAGFIAVQERNHRLQWGIVMTPPAFSVGRWDVNTYLSGRKTSSGFHRTTTGPYIPHSSLAVPANKVFHVQATVVTRFGTFVNVPNACRT
jgi:hypothetical protein